VLSVTDIIDQVTQGNKRLAADAAEGIRRSGDPPQRAREAGLWTLGFEGVEPMDSMLCTNVSHVVQRRTTKHYAYLKSLAAEYEERDALWAKWKRSIEQAGGGDAGVKHEFADAGSSELQADSRSTRASRSSAGGDAVHSDYDLEQKIKQLEQEERSRKRFVESLVCIPRMKKRTRFDVMSFCNNGLDPDPMKTEELFKLSTLWTDMEKCIFVEKFLQFPKQFDRIASFLVNKSTADVVQHYYDSKLRKHGAPRASHGTAVPNRYKALLRQQQQQQRKGGSFKSWNLTTDAMLGAYIRTPCSQLDSGEMFVNDNTFDDYDVDYARVRALQASKVRLGMRACAARAPADRSCPLRI